MSAVKVFAVASSLLVALSALTSAQQPSASALPVFQSSANLVAINVTVTDGRKFVPGLTSADFELYEDGVRQDVQFFESERVPIDLILLVDTSASMRAQLGAVHQAALGFLRTLREQDRGAVVAFNDSVDVVQPLTGDRVRLAEAIKLTKPHGATALLNALYISMKQFGRPAQPDGEVRRQAIAVLTDGDDTSSLISFDDVLATARRSGVNIYAIGLRSEMSAVGDHGRPRSRPSDYALKTLSVETGAQAFFPLVVQDLKGVYATIAQELASQYSIGYSPTNARFDGGFRRITVKIVDRPELRPRARPGYIAAPARAAAGSR